jgi:sec-independent protein translocase protein TatA
MFGFHMPELIIILVVALLIFGPKKLPEMGASIGKSIKEFRKGMNELSQPKEEREDETKSPNLEAIDREVASKKATYDMENSSSKSNSGPHSEVNSSAETKVD